MTSAKNPLEVFFLASEFFDFNTFNCRVAWFTLQSSKPRAEYFFTKPKNLFSQKNIFI